MPSVVLNSSLPRQAKAPSVAAVTHGTEKIRYTSQREVLTEMSNQLGKRYRCVKCITEILCTLAGAGVVTCCGQEMEVQEPRPLPSSD